MPNPDRNPLRKVATTVGGVIAVIGGLLGAGVQFGLLSSVQADAIRTVGEQLPAGILAIGTVITLVTGIISTLVGAFATAKVGERSVTPVSSPRDNEGNLLFPRGGGFPS